MPARLHGRGFSDPRHSIRSHALGVPTRTSQRADVRVGPDGVARVRGEELASLPAHDPGQGDARNLADGRVVAVDLVVVELAPVGDHRLEPLDLALQVLDIAL